MEHAPGGTDEWHSLYSFVIAQGLADKQKFGIGISRGGREAVAGVLELTAGTSGGFGVLG